MQFPEIDDSRIGEGKLKFTSKDSSYGPAPDYILTVTDNPVVGAKIFWKHGESSATYTTDANGEITIDAALLTPGAHTIQIEKYSTTAVDGKYIPLVLRFAPDMEVIVTEKVDTTPTPEPTSVVDDVISTTSAPPTNDTSGFPILVVLALVTIPLVVVGKKRIMQK
jgi:hypothetical protein